LRHWIVAATILRSIGPAEVSVRRWRRQRIYINAGGKTRRGQKPDDNKDVFHHSEP